METGGYAVPKNEQIKSLRSKIDKNELNRKKFSQQPSMDVHGQKKRPMIPSNAIFSDDEIQNSFDLNISIHKSHPKDLLSEFNMLQSIENSIMIEDQSMEISRSQNPQPSRPNHSAHPHPPTPQNYDLIANLDFTNFSRKQDQNLIKGQIAHFDLKFEIQKQILEKKKRDLQQRRHEARERVRLDLKYQNQIESEKEGKGCRRSSFDEQIIDTEYSKKFRGGSGTDCKIFWEHNFASFLERNFGLEFAGPSGIWRIRQITAEICRIC